MWHKDPVCLECPKRLLIEAHTPLEDIFEEETAGTMHPPALEDILGEEEE